MTEISTGLNASQNDVVVNGEVLGNALQDGVLEYAFLSGGFGVPGYVAFQNYQSGAWCILDITGYEVVSGQCLESFSKFLKIFCRDYDCLGGVEFYNQ